MVFADTSIQEQAEQPYRYNGKELEDKHGLNWYDYEARHMEPAMGRFTTIDPLAEKYYSISPYAYVGNNPINAIDPDGRLVIFINGFVPLKNEGGSAKYWNGFDQSVMSHLNDYNAMYINGAKTLNGSGDGFMNFLNNRIISKRYGAGNAYGKAKAQEIFNNLGANETIKIITHSMGAAYAKGFVQSLVDYCINNGIDPSIIEFEADFAPFQPTKQQAVQNIKTFQFSNDKDNVANNKMLGSPKGNIQGAETSHDNDSQKGHSISDFMEKIKLLPTGSYKVENGKIITK